MENKLLKKLNELIVNTNADDSGILKNIHIQSEKKINDEYTLYFFEDDEFVVSWCPVLVSGEIIFTPYDWQLSYEYWIDSDEKELSDYISRTKWIDQEGIDAVIFDGLPRKILDKV